MNRIYQGRVTRVQIPVPAEDPGSKSAGKAKKKPQIQWHDLPREHGEQVLWQHHELFQDAVV